MKNFRFKSIQSRISTWLLLLALIPLIVILVVTYFQRVEVIQSRTFEKITVIRDLKVERLKDWLYQRNADIKMITNYSELTNLELLSNYSPSDTTYKKN